MTVKYLTMDGLKTYDGLIKGVISDGDAKSLKTVAVEGNILKFYKAETPEEGAEADFSIDLPEELFLDQTKTVFVQEFAWTEDAYQGSTDPSLEGKPVLVLAVKGDEDVTYSFLNMETLVDVYTGEDTTTITTTITDENKIKAELKISEAEGNILSVNEDGLFAEAVLDISGKADKLVTSEEGDTVIKEGQILVDDGTGNLAASGKTIAELTKEIQDNYVAITDEEINGLFLA